MTIHFDLLDSLGDWSPFYRYDFKAGLAIDSFVNLFKAQGVIVSDPPRHCVRDESQISQE